MKIMVSVIFALLGLLHLYPAIGVFGESTLRSLYGVDVSAEALMLLMRHRAVMFGILGIALLIAAARPGWRPGCAAAAYVSMLSFMALAWPLDLQQYPALERVFAADALGVVLLTAALALQRGRDRSVSATGTS